MGGPFGRFRGGDRKGKSGRLLRWRRVRIKTLISHKPSHKYSRHKVAVAAPLCRGVDIAGHGDRAPWLQRKPMHLKISYYLDVASSWCFLAEPAWAALK